MQRFAGGWTWHTGLLTSEKMSFLICKRGGKLAEGNKNDKEKDLVASSLPLPTKLAKR